MAEDSASTPTKSRVLVIDDEDVARYGIRRTLASEGYELAEAADGRQALDLVSTFHPDVIISDINMPGMNGITLVREASKLPDAPLVVLVTAFGSEQVAAEALRAGAFDYLSKPFEIDELRVVVRNALEKRRLLRENAEYSRRCEVTLKELRESQSELVQAEKMASLGRLAAGLMHEINTPLGAIKSNLDMIQRSLDRLPATLGEAPPAARELLNKLPENVRISQMACERITKLRSDLRDFARLDEGKLQRADIHPGLESTLALMRHELGDRVRVVKDYGNVPEIECFPDQLNQVFLNLLLNATQAIQGPGEIHIRTRVEGDAVKVSIRDTGQGIAPEHLCPIFDPGFTTKGVGVGSGLGLSISYRIIQAHHGKITVDSQPGQGAEFTITLPIR